MKRYKVTVEYRLEAEDEEEAWELACEPPLGTSWKGWEAVDVEEEGNE